MLTVLNLSHIVRITYTISMFAPVHVPIIIHDHLYVVTYLQTNYRLPVCNGSLVVVIKCVISRGIGLDRCANRVGEEEKNLLHIPTIQKRS